MKSLRPLMDLWSLTYLRWALREIDPTHPDVPAIVLEINRLERGING